MIHYEARAYQASYELSCEVLRKILGDGVRVRSGADEVGPIRCRVSGALYALLVAHTIDRKGHCRTCRRSSAVLRLRRRRCRVHREANFWLRQPTQFLHARVTHEWGLADLSPESGKPDAHEVPARDKPGTADPSHSQETTIRLERRVMGNGNC